MHKTTILASLAAVLPTAGGGSVIRRARTDWLVESQLA